MNKKTSPSMSTSHWTSSAPQNDTTCEFFELFIRISFFNFSYYWCKELNINVIEIIYDKVTRFPYTEED